MKRAWNIKRYGLLLWCFMVTAPIFADVIPTPRDPATIEALISLHNEFWRAEHYYKRCHQVQQCQDDFGQ